MKKQRMGLFDELMEQTRKQEEGQKRLSSEIGILRQEQAAAGTAMRTALDAAKQKTEEVATQTANILSGVEGLEAEQTAAIQLEELGREGATAVQIGLRAGAAVSPQVGKFAKHYPVWLADEGTEEVNSIKYYPATGMAYCCIAAIQRFSHYTPDVATNNYCSYPAPDEEGIYPYVYGMLVWPGMQVRDGSGDIYTCILTEGTHKLVYAPSAVPSIFKKE